MLTYVKYLLLHPRVVLDELGYVAKEINQNNAWLIMFKFKSFIMSCNRQRAVTYMYSYFSIISD